MKTILIVIALICGFLCNMGCIAPRTMRNMPSSQKLEYKASGDSKVYHNESTKDYTGVQLSMTFTQSW